MCYTCSSKIAKAKCAKAKCGSCMFSLELFACNVEQPASHVASAEQPARSTFEQLSKKLKREHAIAESKFAESKSAKPTFAKSKFGQCTASFGKATFAKSKLNLLKLNLPKAECVESLS